MTTARRPLCVGGPGRRNRRRRCDAASLLACRARRRDRGRGGGRHPARTPCRARDRPRSARLPARELRAGRALSSTRRSPSRGSSAQWRDPRAGLAFVAGPILAPLGLLPLLPLAVQPARTRVAPRAFTPSSQCPPQRSSPASPAASCRSAAGLPPISGLRGRSARLTSSMRLSRSSVPDAASDDRAGARRGRDGAAPCAGARSRRARRPLCAPGGAAAALGTRSLHRWRSSEEPCSFLPSRSPDRYSRALSRKRDG